MSSLDAHLAAPSEASAARIDPADQRAYVRGLETCLREAHHWHSCTPSPRRGQRRSPAPDTEQAKKTQTGQGARQHARQQGAAPQPGPRPGHAAPPNFRSPRAHQQRHPHQHPPPPPYRGTLAQQPGQGPQPTQIHAVQGPPFTQGQGMWGHQYNHHAPAPPTPTP